MTNDITSMFYGIDEEMQDRKVHHEILENLSSKHLMEEAQDSKYANCYTKLTRFLLPTFSSEAKEIAREILEERGIDYKIREQEYIFRKEKKKKKLNDFIYAMKNLGYNTKKLFRSLGDLITKNSNYSQTVYK